MLSEEKNKLHIDSQSEISVVSKFIINETLYQMTAQTINMKSKSSGLGSRDEYLILNWLYPFYNTNITRFGITYR